MIQEIKLKLNGQEYTFSFGILFLGEVLERLDLDYNSLLQKVSKNPFKYAPILMEESLRNTAKRINKNIDFTYTDIANWLEKEESLGVDVMLQFIHAFLGTNENKTPIERIEVNDAEIVKKK